MASTTQYLLAARDATQTIPIVFVAVADPVAQGFVASLAQPGEIITGFGLEEPAIGAKWVELLIEIAPGVRSITAIFDPDTSPSRIFLPSIELSLKSLRAELVVSPVRNESEIETAIAEAANRPSSGLLFLPDTLVQSRRDLVVAAVAKHRLPAIYTIPPFAKNGGLIAYGINRHDLFYRAAGYVDRILKGASPGSLPVADANEIRAGDQSQNRESARRSRATDAARPRRRGHRVRRREFITLLGGAAAAWPLMAYGQQEERMRRIGILTGLAGEDAETKARISAFLQELQRLGWTEGRNLRIDIRAGAGNAVATRKYAAELVALGPDVILGTGASPAALLVEASHRYQSYSRLLSTQ